MKLELVRKRFYLLSLSLITGMLYFGHLYQPKNAIKGNANAKEDVAKGSAVRHVEPLLMTSAYLKVFDRQSYEESLKNHPTRTELCKLKHLLKVAYHICAHEPEQDRFVSKSILNGQGWEVDLTLFLSHMLEAYGKDSILLDVGANIGSHLLFAAAKGHSVWGVEPQTINLVKMYHAALIDATDSRITFLQNTLDQDYLKVHIKQTLGNIGGSFVINGVGEAHSLEEIQSVLLSDVINHIRFNRPKAKNLTIIMKIDIESYECRAFLGSPSVLNSTHSGFYIPYVVMEWTYAQGKEPPYKYPKACPRQSVIDMTKLFTINGYVPFSKNRVRLQPDQSDTWNVDVIWQHKNAHQLLL